MAFDEYQFLRYYIPGSLYVIYVTALVFPILSPQVFSYLAKNSDVLLGTVGGVFAASLSIGYLIYSFYDWVEYNKTAMGMKKKKLFAYIEREAPGWKDLPEPERKESLDMIYLTFGDPAANEMSSSQVRGMWSHYNARKVCCKFVPFFAAITVFLSFILDFFVTKKLYAIPGHWEWFLLAVAAILLISVTLRQGSQRPLNEATTLDYFFIRNRIEENKAQFKKLMEIVLEHVLAKGSSQEKPENSILSKTPVEYSGPKISIDASYENKLLGLFGHVSRMYNSTINAMIAVIFGWLAFNGLAFSLRENAQFELVLLLIGFFIVLIGCYLYVRALQFGRYIATMMRDLNLGNYLEKGLPMFLLVTRLNQRSINKPNEWTWGERISLILLVIFFAIPSIFLFLVH